MNDISITEAYFVYSVRGKGKLSGNDCRKVTGLLTAALWEMTQTLSKRCRPLYQILVSAAL